MFCFTIVFYPKDIIPPKSWHIPDWIIYKNPTPETIISIEANDNLNPWMIYYIINGRNYSGAYYNKPVKLKLLPGSYDLEYWAIDIVGNEEEHHKISFNVSLEDTLSKSIFFNGSYEWKQNHWIITPNTKICFDLEKADVNKAYYKIDEGKWKEYKECFNLSIGNHTLYYYGIDALGRYTPTASMSLEVVESLAPTTSILINPSLPNGKNGWYISNVTIKLKAWDEISGIDSTYYKIDNEKWKK